MHLRMGHPHRRRYRDPRSRSRPRSQMGSCQRFLAGGVMSAYAPVQRTAYIVVYHGSKGDRYIERRAHKRYRGMYRNRRLVGVDKALWTDDRTKAATFGSK